MPTDTGAYFDKLRTQFQAGGGDIDVIGADVIWPVQFAAQRLAPGRHRQVPEERAEQVPARAHYSLDVRRQDLRRAVVHGRGTPLLPGGSAGEVRLLRAPEDLGRAARDGHQGREGSRTSTTASSSRETSTRAGCATAASTSGPTAATSSTPSDPNKVVIDSPEAIAGLATEQSIVDDGVAPQAVATYTETETDPAFLGNKAVFARNWPYMYALAGTKDFPGRQARADRGRSPSRGAGQRPRQRPRRVEHAHQRPDGYAGRGVGVRPVHDQRAGQRQRALVGIAPADPAQRCTRTRRSGTPYRSSCRARRRSRTPGRGRSRPTTRTCRWRCRSSSTAVVKGDTSPEDAVASLQDEPEADHRGGA